MTRTPTPQPGITSTSELLKALVPAMKRTGEQREYPKAVIDMSEFILAHLAAHKDVSNLDILSAFGTLEGTCPCCGAGPQSALATLFHSLADSPKRYPYSSLVVELIANILQFMDPRSKASRLDTLLDAVERCSGHQTWFKKEHVGRRKYLRTTKNGEDALGISAVVKLPSRRD